MRRLSLVIAGVLALACGAERPSAPAPRAAGAGRLESRPCWFAPDLADYDVSVECAELHVPERWDAPDPAREVRIPVVTLRAGGKARKARWATLIPGGGGPGGGVGLESDDAATTVEDHAAIAADSGGDLVIVDTRGAGIAEPAFRCEEMRAATLRWLRTNPSIEQEAALWSDAALRCRKRLADAGLALDAYDAHSVTRDLEALREALGYEQWNLFGTSYAGEIALHYARVAPASIRALVLDSPGVPGGAVVSPAWFAHVLDALFARCAADAHCARDLPAPGAALDRLLRRFAEKPLALTVSDPAGLAPLPVAITPVRLLDLIFDAMYDTKRAHEIPIMLTAADRGSYDWLHEFAREYVWSLLDPRFSPALLDAVPCRESIPFGDLARAEREARANPWARAFVGVERVTTAVCRAWNVGRAEPPAVAFGGPALVLAGQLDPVIALPDVERAAHTLHAQLIEFPATGHSADASWWQCLDPLIARFLADPNKPLDDRDIEVCRREADATEFTALERPESLSELVAAPEDRESRAASGEP
jgi:pimeloyl-ACP methyl ester carboxylesterase